MFGIIHLGMRPESRHEVDALEGGNGRRQGGVLAIRPTAGEGTLTLAGVRHDLATGHGLVQLEKALVRRGMTPERARAFVELLASQQPAEHRDELARFGLALHDTGRGALAASRLVLSGHNYIGGIANDARTGLTWPELAAVARLFPEGAARIRHLAISSCNSRDAARLFMTVFPNLESVWAYDGASPKAEQGAPVHLRRWESTTDGDRAGRVDPGPRNVTTWNVEDGWQ